MSQRENEFRKKLRETFRLEAEDHIRNLSSGLVDLEKTGDAEQRAGIVETIFRESHSLKGSARIVGLTDIETVCQALESVLAALRKNELTLTPEVFDGLHSTVDNLGQLLGAMDRQRTPRERALADATTRYLESILKGRPAAPPKPVEEKKQVEEAAAAAHPEQPAGRPLQTETVRIATSRLESLLLEAEELLAARQAAAQLSRDMEEANLSLAAWQEEWRKISAAVSRVRPRSGDTTSTRGQGKPDPQLGRLVEFLDWNYEYFKSLEDRIATLARTSRRDSNSLSTMVTVLTQDMKKVLMSPFSSLADTFPRFVRDVSREEGKDIELVVRGADIEMDRRIIEQMKDPLTHLIRNSIGHGIETPQVRRQQGKPARGTITLAISQKGSSNVEIVVADDGRGIDVGAVCEACVKRGIVSQEEVRKLSETGMLSLIWSGVSTSPTVTDLSGRGLGLAIARQRVEQLRGTISVDTKPEQGTTFTMVLPLTLAEFRGLVVRAGDQLLVLPTVNVERAFRVKTESIETVENRETVRLDGRVISLVRLASVLEIAPEPATQDTPGYVPALLLSLGGMQIAFQVDEIIGEQEVLVKSLGKQLTRVRNVAGASMLGTGKVVPVLNVYDLMKSAIKAQAVPARAPAPREAEKQQSILVVEDSITARTLLKNILETVGYRVRTAVDGTDALALLRADRFDLVVSDVDMPRMNGFELTAKIRLDKKLAPTPVILVTALESREDRERGVDVGANAYIVKSSFDQGNLIEVIKRLV